MKVLIVRLSSMGDVISALPALTDAKGAIPKIEFDWVVEENFSEIPSWHPAVNKVIPIALRRWRKKLLHPNTIKELRSFWQNLRLKNYDYIIDPQGLLKSSIVAAFGHGPTYGFNTKSARETLASLFYKNKFDIPKNLHVVERTRKLFALSLNYKITSDFPNYGNIKEKFHQQKKVKEKYLVFLHGTSRDNKCWAEGKWIELARLAKDVGLKIKLPWGNKLELTRANNISNASNNVEVLPKLTLTEMGNILLNAEGVVAVDTGFGHLAAALEIPTISLYGPTDPKLGGAYGKDQAHLTNMGVISPQMVWQTIRDHFDC